MENNLSIEEEYQSLSELDRMLLRPGMYLGNIHYNQIDYNLYKPSSNKIELLNNVNYNAGLLKLVDEILTNSVDAFIKRNIEHDITKIKVIVNQNGSITISDDGGIPVVKHKTEKKYLPHLIFGVIGAGSNYTKKIDRIGAGLNGLGAKLTNIYSTEFQVITSDGKNRFIGNWSNNMKDFKQEVQKIHDVNDHGTSVAWKIDFSRFEDIDKLDLSTIRIIQKRCIDAAASNVGLIVEFESDIKDGILNSTWSFETFTDYVKMFINSDDVSTMHSYTSGRDSVVVIPRSIGFDFGFVNGAVCSQGTHMKKIKSQIFKRVLKVLKEKKNIELIETKDIDAHISIFCKTIIPNPDYDSQAKDQLTNRIPQATLYLNEKYLTEFETSELIDSLVDYYEIKYVAEQKKKTRKINRELTKIKTEKTIKCSGKGDDNELWIFEGDSAKGGFRNARDPLTQAAFLLRGKLLNTINKDPESIMKNKEFFELCAVLKLQFFETKKNLKNCPFGKIVIACDMDHDGSHITGLLCTFFCKFFPELVKAGKLYRALSPIIVAKKGNREFLYFTLDEYKKEAETDKLKGFKILYKKGLGGLSQDHYQIMMNDPRFEKLIWSDDCLDTIDTWFNKSVDTRKNIIAMESGYTTDNIEIFS